MDDQESNRRNFLYLRCYLPLKSVVEHLAVHSSAIINLDANIVAAQSDHRKAVM